MTTTTNTYLAVAQAVADALHLRTSGAFTSTPSTSSLLAATYPFKDNSTDASTTQYVNDQLYVTSGTVPVPNPNGISAFAPSTGGFTPSFTYTTKPDATASFDIYSRGVGIAEIKDAINTALRQMRYKTESPLSFVTDADMEASGVTNWTASVSTVSKVTNSNAIRNGQALRVLNAGYAQSATITVDPTNAGQWYVHAWVRADVGTARLEAYDVTNSAIISSEDWTLRGWGALDFQFTLPATCEALAFRLRSVAASDDCYWEDIIAFPEQATQCVLPSWVASDQQVTAIWRGDTDVSQFDQQNFYKYPAFRLVSDPSNPNNQYRVQTAPTLTMPAWVEGWRPYPTLSADSDTTFCDLDWLTLAAKVVLLKRLVNRAPSEETAAWKAEYREERLKLIALNSARMPKTILMTPGW